MEIRVAYQNDQIVAFGFNESMEKSFRFVGLEVAMIEEDLIPDIIDCNNYRCITPMIGGQ